MLKPLLVRVAGPEGDVELPHWFSRPEEDWAAFESFQTFLERVWEHLGLPKPTRAQYEIAHRLQYGYDSYEKELLSVDEALALLNHPREDIIRAFRGLGKSYITAAFVIWRLMRNPRDEKILVVSATGGKAKEFVAQVKGLIESMPLCQWLLEGDRENGARRRDEADQFDVAGANLAQSYSVKARGIDGQITGSRATLVVADDIEVPQNSKTEAGRAAILSVVRSDFGPIVKTEHGRGDTIFLGTPQTEESVYNVLVTELGYRCWCLPVRFPAAEKLKNYTLLTPGRVPIDILAPYLKGLIAKGLLTHGVPTDSRFGHEEMLKEEAKGASHFALQMMLDTSLSDAERYPLKTHDLICFSTNFEKAPRTVQWGVDSNRRNILSTVPNLGFSGDFLLRPLFVDSEWRDYDQLMIYVDPAGRGKDETAWAVIGQMNGMFYLIDLQGEVGDPNTAMQRIALDVKKYRVREVIVEPNFGQGMWAIAFQPILEKVYPGKCAVKESEWAKGQKEARIIDTLEPVLTAHRLVVNEAILKADAEMDERDYSFLYQLTHITRERNCLKHDDRLDAVAGAVAYFMQSMGMDQVVAAKQQKDAEQERIVEAFTEALNGGASLFRGRRLRMDDIDDLPDEWSTVWNMKTVR